MLYPCVQRYENLSGMCWSAAITPKRAISCHQGCDGDAPQGDNCFYATVMDACAPPEMLSANQCTSKKNRENEARQAALCLPKDSVLAGDASQLFVFYSNYHHGWNASLCYAIVPERVAVCRGYSSGVWVHWQRRSV